MHARAQARDGLRFSRPLHKVVIVHSSTMQEAQRRIDAWRYNNFLDLSGLGLEELPTLPASLEVLGCWNNQLQTLSTLPASLKKLDCWNNQLQALPTLPASLEVLQCGNNQLQTLPVLPASLKGLNCQNNQLQALPVLPASLKWLICGDNPLQTLPTLPASLEWLYCGDNQLQTLPTLPASLKKLYCSENPLPFFDLLTWRRLDRIRASMHLRPLQRRWRQKLIRRRTRPKDRLNYEIYARPGTGQGWFAFLEAIR